LNAKERGAPKSARSEAIVTFATIVKQELVRGLAPGPMRGLAPGLMRHLLCEEKFVDEQNILKYFEIYNSSLLFSNEFFEV